MKLALVCAMAAWLPTLVAAGHAALFEFNNGVPEDGKSCTSAEWATIQAVMEQAAPEPTRRLRQGQFSHRSLNTCAYCGAYCVKVGNGCVKSGRRRIADTVTQRRAVTPCDPRIVNVTAALDVLLPTMVGSCQALLAAPRKITCVETTEYCFVQSFALWDARSDTIIHETLNATGTSFCKGRMISFGAKTNYFIGKMNFVVRGTSPGSQYFTNRTEWSAPYFLNGNGVHRNGALNVGGTYIPAGDYTLTATSEDDPTKAKTIAFQSKNC